MGAVRGVLFSFVAVFLFLSFFLLNLSLTLQASLNYDNVQREAPVFAGDLLNQAGMTNAIDQNYPMLLAYCASGHTNYVFSTEGFTFDIPCTIVFQGQDKVVDEVVKQAVYSVYYKNYGCSFIDCFNKYPTMPLFLVSQTTYNYFTGKVYLFLIISAILFVLTFFLVDKKTNGFILPGILLLASTAFFIGVNYALSMFSNDSIFRLIGIFFSQVYSAAIKPAIVGAGLIGLGIVFNIFKIPGLLMKNLKEKKKEDEEEVEEVKIIKRPVKKKSK